jgi:endonuclease/exonuclease/phosphatase family metal-dependent hydrolase
VALLSRWPIVQRDVITMPARHRAWDPVILRASVAHPAGPLPVLVACLEHATTYSDDRLAQASLLADLATDPATDGPCPSLAIGDLNAAPDSSVLRPLSDVLIDAWRVGGGARDAVTLPSTHPSAPLEAGPELVDQRIDHVFSVPATRISWSTSSPLSSRGMPLTACSRPTIERSWLISVGMTADTTRPAADDDASTLIENLAGIGDTCIRTIHVAVPRI